MSIYAPANHTVLAARRRLRRYHTGRVFTGAFFGVDGGVRVVRRVGVFGK